MKMSFFIPTEIKSFYGKGWGQNAKLGPHSAIWGKLGTALQAYGSVSAGREKWPFNVLFSCPGQLNR